jgi:DNA-binding winged helix-turn-helix (wHTH) protein/TolB-like protein
MNEEHVRTLFEFAGFRADPLTRRLFSGDDQLTVTPKAFETLLVLISNRGKVVSKTELMDAIWADTSVEENNLTQQIATLRRAFGERAGEHRFIVTVPGKGYSFVAPVNEIDLTVDDEIVMMQATRSSVTIDVTNGYSFDWRTFFRRSGVYGASIALAYTLVVCLMAVWPFLTGSSVKPAPQTIAVLPFRTTFAADEALGAGISDTLRARLGSLEDVAVRASTPTAPADALIAGRELEADVVFAGSIQREDGRVRVAVEVVDVRRERILWGQTFDYESSSAFELQDAIAREAIRVISAPRL